uniref:NADPH-quinone oxidoreductase subunit Uic n=1 Tax=Rhizophora mucronata TaxID=61149 RepID=A0A2P2K470_RHIMU
MHSLFQVESRNTPKVQCPRIHIILNHARVSQMNLEFGLITKRPTLVFGPPIVRASLYAPKQIGPHGTLHRVRVQLVPRIFKWNGVERF